jgi:hypothetical protein
MQCVEVVLWQSQQVVVRQAPLSVHDQQLEPSLQSLYAVHPPVHIVLSQVQRLEHPPTQQGEGPQCGGQPQAWGSPQ